MKITPTPADIATATRFGPPITRGRVYLWAAGQPGKRAIYAVGDRDNPPLSGWHNTRLGAIRAYFTLISEAAAAIIEADQRSTNGGPNER